VLNDAFPSFDLYGTNPDRNGGTVTFDNSVSALLIKANGTSLP
jgi:hypothetical protein